MLSAALLLFANTLLLSLRLSGGGSFPKPLSAAEEREYLRRWGQGDQDAREMRKERNPARPAVTRLCGICYGIKQKERLSGEAADKPGLGIITGMWSSVGMC